MVFLISIPLWLAAIFIIVWAFTHPARATISIARFLLGLIGFLMIIVTLFSFTMTDNGPIFVLTSVACVGILIACFVARNKLSKL